MTALHAFLVLWNWFSHTEFVVIPPSHTGRQAPVLFGGNGPDCLAVARSIPHAIIEGASGQVWPN